MTAANKGTGLRRRSVLFHDEQSFTQAIHRLFPVRGSMTISTVRYREAQQSIIIETARVLQTVLGFKRGNVEVRRAAPPQTHSARSGKPVGESHGSWSGSGLSIFIDRTYRLGIRACEEYHPHPLAVDFCGAAFSALKASLATLLRSRDKHGSEDVDKASEMLTLAIEEWTAVAFLRKLIQQPIAPLLHLFLGHMPFGGGFQPAMDLWRWLRELPASTFEGAPLSTGIVLEIDTDGHKQKKVPLGNIAFRVPMKFREALRKKHVLVLADGERSFLLTRSDMTVHGIQTLKKSIDEQYLTSSVPMGQRPDLPLRRLWLQAVDHRRLIIYGTTSDKKLMHVADVQQGKLRLNDPRSKVAAIEHAIENVTNPAVRANVPAFVSCVMRRARAGHGGGIIIGDAPPVLKSEAIDPPFAVRRGDERWVSLLNPDGAVVFNHFLAATSFACFIKTSAKHSTSGAGTRHAAISTATKGRDNVGIAISDDGTVTVFIDGAIAHRFD